MSSPPTAPARRAPVELVLLALLAVTWGSSYAFTKVTLTSIPPLTSVAGRVLIAAALLWLLVLWRRRPIPRDVATWRLLAVQSVLQSTLPFSMTTWGQQYVDSGLAGVLNSTSPVFVTLITLAWTRHEAIGWRRIAGLLAGLAGVVLIVGIEAMHGLGRAVAGQTAIVLATIGFALAAIWGRKFAGVAVEVTAAGTLTIAGLTLLPVALAVEQPWTAAPTTVSIVALLMQAAFAGALGFLLYFRLVKTIGSLGVASVGYLKAAVSVLIGVVLMSEPVTVSLVVGLALVVAGVALINAATGKAVKGPSAQRAPAE